MPSPLFHAFASWQACKITFSYKLHPMGSHPRVADSHSTYDLFGPVSKFWSHKYDKAMICYLTCLREFGSFAYTEDMAARKPDPFKYPFPLDGDKVRFASKCCLGKEIIHGLAYR
jgi:beclin 1